MSNVVAAAWGKSLATNFSFLRSTTTDFIDGGIQQFRTTESAGIFYLYLTKTAGFDFRRSSFNLNHLMWPVLKTPTEDRQYIPLQVPMKSK